MKTQQILTALSVILLSACVSKTLSPEDLKKQAAAKARVELGISYLYQGDTAQAKLNLDKALAHAPNYYLVHSGLAYYYQARGDVEKAEQAYQTAIKLDNTQGDTYNNYGTFLCSQGKFEQSYAQFQRALKAPNYYRQADTLENFAICALSAKNTALYEQNLAELTKVDSARAEKLKKTVATTQK
ncbi:type IV pilus assembly protein PilF [Cricetibacter osteomyelitidis]|uniref:Type IV pilus assembly protein PilF n=2 Tax=Cricetibacter osteomyelitidis TaxID=1521931 RepID=A0A4R2SSS7_9PAST|nr:type IV pilus biogenesis/stability protein PilW [Cricetibacter osteomyelitidis]TCP93407.1 type IV pilus assembly protein PilF [Cricetibacter osteomyelitidis]